jgi:hypothetical protein
MIGMLTSSVVLLVVMVHLVGVVIHRLAAPCRRLRFSHRATLFLMAASATIITMAIGQQLLLGQSVVSQNVVNLAWALIVLSLTVISFGSKRLIYRKKPLCHGQQHRRSVVKTSSML